MGKQTVACSQHNRPVLSFSSRNKRRHGRDGLPSRLRGFGESTLPFHDEFWNRLSFHKPLWMTPPPPYPKRRQAARAPQPHAAPLPRIRRGTRRATFREGTARCACLRVQPVSGVARLYGTRVSCPRLFRACRARLSSSRRRRPCRRARGRRRPSAGRGRGRGRR